MCETMAGLGGLWIPIVFFSFAYTFLGGMAFRRYLENK